MSKVFPPRWGGQRRGLVAANEASCGAGARLRYLLQQLRYSGRQRLEIISTGPAFLASIEAPADEPMIEAAAQSVPPDRLAGCYPSNVVLLVDNENKRRRRAAAGSDWDRRIAAMSGVDVLIIVGFTAKDLPRQNESKPRRFVAELCAARCVVIFERPSNCNRDTGVWLVQAK
jgi:hypothetical protein